MAGLSERERNMGLLIIAILVVFAHVFASKKLVELFNGKKTQLVSLEQQVQQITGQSAVEAAIQEEKDWLAKYEPAPKSYEDVQTELQQFLVNAGSSVGVTPFSQKIIKAEETQEGGSGNYRRVEIQISAQGEQEKIFQWLTKIHQPSQFRAITYMKLEANDKVEGEIICHIIAKQWLVPKL